MFLDDCAFQTLHGLVVTDKEEVRAAVEREGVEVAASVPGGTLDFRDPWGNLFQIVDYREVQFTKDESVLRAMGLDRLEKSESALEELRAKGLAD